MGFRPVGRFATRGKALRLRGFSCRSRVPRGRGGRDPHALQQHKPRTRMTKRMESKYKIDRRMGENIWGRPKSPVNRREYGPGQHGQRRKSKLSDYGVQLKAKQKLRGYYGHIKVNGKRVTIPSYRVKVGDVVEVKEKSKQLALVMEAQALAERDVPDYIEVDASKLTAKLARVPLITDVPYAVQMEPHLVVEYYSR